MRAIDLKRWATSDGVLIQFLTRDYKETDKAFMQAESGREMDVKISPRKKKRSLDANAYMWVLCDKIAQVIRSTKEEVYREVVHDVGVFDYIAVVDKAVDKFVENWKSRGTGWLAEAEESTIDGCKKVCVYYGSSTYDTKEMSRLIDEVVSRAAELGIETIPKNELAELEEEWGKYAR